MEGKHEPQDIDWKKVFEVDDYLYFYEDTMLTAERTRREVNFIEDELELSSSGKLLDLACGHGRHCSLLADIGYTNVVGVDINENFLKIARENSPKKGSTPKYIQADMRELSFENEFEWILLLFSSFGYFSVRENKRVLYNIEKALKPGGVFCLDVTNRDGLLRNFLPYIVTEKNDDLMIDRNRFDSSTGRLHNRRVIIRDGERKDKPFSMKIYSFSELRTLLQEVGLEIKKTYGSWERDTFDKDSKRMIIVAQKA